MEMRLTVSVILCCCLWNSGSAVRPPRILSFSEKPVLANPGGNVTIFCKAAGDTEAPDIEWFFNKDGKRTDVDYLQIKSSVRTDNRRNLETLSALTLYNIDPRYEGEFECEAALHSGELTTSALINITVEWAPRILSHSERPVFTNEGGNVTIFCKAAADKAPPEIRWYFNKDGKRTALDYMRITFNVRKAYSDNPPATLSALTLYNAEPRLEGMFECEAASEFGGDLKNSAFINVTVEFAPVLNVTLCTEAGAGGEQVSTLQCFIRANPLVAYSHFKNNEHKLRNTVLENTDEPYTVKLSQKFGADMSLSGEFICYAKNRLGSRQKSIVFGHHPDAKIHNSSHVHVIHTGKDDSPELSLDNKKEGIHHPAENKDTTTTTTTTTSQYEDKKDLDEKDEDVRASPGGTKPIDIVSGKKGLAAEHLLLNHKAVIAVSTGAGVLTVAVIVLVAAVKLTRMRKAPPENNSGSSRHQLTVVPSKSGAASSDGGSGSDVQYKTGKRNRHEKPFASFAEAKV